jgi:(2Fe-2S) ferredoxin
MFVDGKFYGEMNPVKAKRIVEKINRRKSGVKS